MRYTSFAIAATAMLLLHGCLGGCGSLGWVNPEGYRTNKINPETTLEIDMSRGKAKLKSTQERDFEIAKAGYDEATQRWIVEGLKYLSKSVDVIDADARRMPLILEGLGMEHETARIVANNLKEVGLAAINAVKESIGILYPNGLPAKDSKLFGSIASQVLTSPDIQKAITDRILAEVAKQKAQP